MRAALLLVLALDVAWAGWTMTNITFESADVPSGQLTMHGNIVWPDGPGPFPAVVLITGSGGANRWEAYQGAAMYHDIAIGLANAGIAVLAYDKRLCIKGAQPLCQTVVCTTPGQTNCLNMAPVSIHDFQSDGTMAMQFLVAQPNIDATRTGVIGHSEGTSYAAPVATATNASQVVLLNGAGVTWADITVNQAIAQMPLYEEMIAYWLKQPKSPTQKQTLAYLEGTLSGLNCTVETAQAQYALLEDGIYNLTSQAVICPFGMYWAGGQNIESGVICPGTCGTGMCMQGQNTPECLALCKSAATLGMCVPMPFAASQLDYFNPVNFLANLAAVKGRIMASNSWTDYLVVPDSYMPLHMMLEQQLPGTHDYLNGTQGTVTAVAVRIFANLTHENIPFLTTDVHVAPEVTAAISSFLLEGFYNSSMQAPEAKPARRPVVPAPLVMPTGEDGSPLPLHGLFDGLFD